MLGSPCVGTISNISIAWTREEYEMMREISKNYDIDYLDLSYDLDSGIDFATDYCDGGVHYNIRGGIKVAKILEEYLRENYTLTQNENELWNRMLEKYQFMKEIALLGNTDKISDYFEKLINNRSKWDIIFSCAGDYTLALTEDEYLLLDQLGLKLIREGQYQDSYINVVKEGEVEYEAYSGKQLKYRTNIAGKTFEVYSSGWFTQPKSSIIYGNQEYAVNWNGLNIVVIDHNTGEVIDSICWGSGYNTIVHSSEISQYFRQYEKKMMQDYYKQKQ